MTACRKSEAACICKLEEGHDGDHVCGGNKCKGSWTYDEQGQFVPITWPSGGVVALTPFDEVVERLMGILQ